MTTGIDGLASWWKGTEYALRGGIDLSDLEGSVIIVKSLLIVTA